MGIADRIGQAVRWFQRTRVGRTLQRVTDANGEILAAGMSFTAVFSAFAALYVFFAVFGLVLSGSPELYASVVDAISGYLPGLIGTDGSGMLDPTSLTSSATLTWSGIVALGLLTLTMLGWLATTRSALRGMFQLSPPTVNGVLLKALDLLLAIVLGALILASATLSVVSTAAASWVASALGVPADDPGLRTTVQVVGFAIALVADVVTVAVLLAWVARIPLRLPALALGSLLGGVALGVLKSLGTALLGGATSNPLLASFAVLVGLLLFFNFVNRALIYTAAFIAVGHGALRPDAVSLRQQAVLMALAAAGTPHPAPRPWWRRLLPVRRRDRAGSASESTSEADA